MDNGRAFFMLKRRFGSSISMNEAFELKNLSFTLAVPSTALMIETS
jgi:hypothetical protein